MSTEDKGPNVKSLPKYFKGKPSNSDAKNDYPVRTRRNSDVLRDILDEEFQNSIRTFTNDPRIEKKYAELSGYLRRESAEFENRQAFSRSISQSGKTKGILEHLSPRYSVKYRALKTHIAEWKPKREALIRNLKLYINKLDRNFKWSTVGRLVASSVEVTGTVGGLIFRSESGWANHALNAASFCGLCGLFFTVAEVEQSKRILDEVTESIENDHRLLLPIVKWFEEAEELDSIVQELFPHGIDTDIVQQIQEASSEQDEYLKIFKAGLLSNVRKNSELFEDRDFLHSLQLFAGSEMASMWWNRIVYRKHPISLDLSRMALQMEFGQLQSIIFQCIPALPLEQQRLTSLPVAGRIMLNLLTFYDSCVDLSNGAKSTHSDKLKRQLKTMKDELQVIEDTFRMIKP